MKDITVIILTKNEEKNIQSSIESAFLIAKRTIVIDCGSADNTVQIAKENGAEVFFHEWECHYKQFNWALENCEIKTKWVFRLDADERISKELAKEICDLDENSEFNGFSMRWKLFFMGKWIKHGGTHKPYFLRLFKFGEGKVEEKLMDEHIVVNGSVKKLKSDLIHYDYKGLDCFLSKHINYSNLEIETVYKNKALNKKRGFYYKLPLFIRAKFYYLYRLIFQLGFLDGKEGRILLFFQSFWYRYLIDAKVYEKEKCK